LCFETARPEMSRRLVNSGATFRFRLNRAGFIMMLRAARPSHRTARAGKGYLSRDVLPVAALRLDSRAAVLWRRARAGLPFRFLVEFFLVTALLSHSARWHRPVDLITGGSGRLQCACSPWASIDRGGEWLTSAHVRASTSPLDVLKTSTYRCLGQTN